MTEEDIEAHEGSGNVFADLGLPDADELILKSRLVIELRRLIAGRGLTQSAAAERLGITQPDLSHLLRGRLRGVSVERLLRMLTAFDQDVEIVLRPHERAGEPGRISFNARA
jgi:predicted XRE-type DNA-binding protein